jgi:proteasome lid subunit RPN8/RPN11
MSCSTETTLTTSPPTAAPPAANALSRKAPTRLRLTPEQRRQLEMVVDASYPFEACGVMIGRTGRRTVSVEDVFHARNLNVERARDRFLLDPEDHLAADRVARRRGLEIVGFWHSHPDHPARPSVTDLEAAWEGYSYLIVSTPAFGANGFRSWRLHDGQFLEEGILDPAEALS